MKHFYVYYSYEEYGRGYIGKRECKCEPEKDINYFGSFSDKTFKPTQKIILDTFNTREEVYEAECILHEYYQVDKNPHFANRAKQTSKKFYFYPGGKNNPMYGKYGEEHPAYGYRFNDEVCKYRSERQVGEKNHMYGRYGEEHPSYGTKRTEDERKKLSEGRRGEKNHMYGKKSWNSGKTGERMWITNNIESRHVENGSEIPKGWRRGRGNFRNTNK